MSLTNLEHRLLARCRVAAVSIQEDDPTEPVSDQVVGQIIQQVEIDSRAGRQRAGKVHVMVRVPQPHQRREQHTVLHRAAHTTHDLTQQQTISEEWHVSAMLLQRRNRDHDGNVARQVFDIRPSQISQVHGVSFDKHHSGHFQRDPIRQRAALEESARFLARMPAEFRASVVRLHIKRLDTNSRVEFAV